MLHRWSKESRDKTKPKGNMEKTKLSFALASSVTKSGYTFLNPELIMSTRRLLIPPFSLINPIQEQGRDGTFFLQRGRTSHQRCHLHKTVPHVTTSLAAHARKFPFPVQALVWLMQLQQRRAQLCPTAMNWHSNTLRTAEKGDKISVKIWATF